MTSLISKVRDEAISNLRPRKEHILPPKPREARYGDTGAEIVQYTRLLPDEERHPAREKGSIIERNLLTFRLKNTPNI